MNPTHNLRRPLTVIQTRVAELVGKGESYPTIARSLNIGKRTVRFHVVAIDRKLPDNIEAPTPYRRVFLWKARLREY